MNKGQISYIEPIFTLLLAGVLAGAIAVILPGQVTNIRPEIEANEFENGAIILANSLLGDNSLIYSDGITYYRGVFDETKLDDLFFKKGSSTKLYNCKPPESSCAINTYPNTYALIMISDIENNNGWFTGTNRLGSDQNSANIEKCFASKTEMGNDKQGKIFEPNSDLVAILELDKCSLMKYSNIMNLGFPVSIHYPSGEIHMGLLKVLVVE